MATNYTQPGNVLTLTAPSGGLLSGQGVLIGDLFVVALNTAAEGDAFEGQCVGVWALPKVAGTAWTEGQAIYWTGTAATHDSDGTTLIGHAAADAADTAEMDQVRLQP